LRKATVKIENLKAYIELNRLLLYVKMYNICIRNLS